MKVISFIEDFKAVDKIVRHLELFFRAEHPPPAVQQELLMEGEELGRVFLRASVRKEGRLIHISRIEPDWPWLPSQSA